MNRAVMKANPSFSSNIQNVFPEAMKHSIAPVFSCVASLDVLLMRVSHPRVCSNARGCLWSVVSVPAVNNILDWCDLGWFWCAMTLYKPWRLRKGFLYSDTCLFCFNFRNIFYWDGVFANISSISLLGQASALTCTPNRIVIIQLNRFCSWQQSVEEQRNKDSGLRSWRRLVF